MLKILRDIKYAKQGSDIYSLIERIAENVKDENPSCSDEYNWFEAQRRINYSLLEEKLAERIFSTYPERNYDSCVEEARLILDKTDFDRETVEDLASDGISIQKIIECSLKYFSNQFYLHHKSENSAGMNKTFDDWKKAIDCVAENISFY
ncbi:MAG: hypothetical protein AABW81_01355 [Nanoarchaeota archaeon]